MDWNAHIKELLVAGASIDGIATHIGVTGNAVREILAGRTKAPRADAAFRLAALRPDVFSPAPEQPATGATPIIEEARSQDLARAG